MPLTIINHFCLCVMHRPLNYYIFVPSKLRGSDGSFVLHLEVAFSDVSPLLIVSFHLPDGQFLIHLICTALSVFISLSQGGDKKYNGGLESIHLRLSCCFFTFFACDVNVFIMASLKSLLFQSQRELISSTISFPWPSWLLSFIPFTFSLDF